VITQSAMAFTLIVNAFSLIVTQIQSLSNFAAVVVRLNSLIEALERKQPAERQVSKRARMTGVWLTKR